MTTPSYEQRIMRLSEQDCRATLLFLAHRYPYEVSQAIDTITRTHRPKES